MTDFKSSALSADISSPRFIGPGCITIAFLDNLASRIEFKPKRFEYSCDDGKKESFIRSSWIRSIITTSHFEISSSRSYEIFTGQSDTPTGNKVGGATNVTCAPNLVNRSTLLLATLEWRISPTINTFTPDRSFSLFLKCCFIVNASRSACVGCSCVPSPAFITAA